MAPQPEVTREAFSSILLQRGRATQGPCKTGRGTLDRETQNCESCCKHESPRQGWPVSGCSCADSDKSCLPGPLRSEGFRGPLTKAQKEHLGDC